MSVSTEAFKIVLTEPKFEWFGRISRVLLIKFVPLIVLYSNIIVTLYMKMKFVCFQVYSIHGICCDNRGAVSIYNGANSRYLLWSNLVHLWSDP